MADDILDLRTRIAEFAEAREWGPFHTPRNLILALSGEVGELAAIVQWLTDEQVERGLAAESKTRSQLSDEMADVFIYLLRLADVCGIDVVREAFEKIDRNEYRYPQDLVRGSAVKYTELMSPVDR